MENLNYQNGENSKPVGPIIGLVIVIVIIIAGAIYFAMERSKNSGIVNNNTEQNVNTEQGPIETANPEVSNPEDLNSLETELNSISTTDMDADIENVQ